MTTKKMWIASLAVPVVMAMLPLAETPRVKANEPTVGGKRRREN